MNRTRPPSPTRRLLSLAAGSWPTFVVVAGCGWLGALLIVSQARLLAQVIHGVFLGGQGWVEVAPAAGLLLAIVAGRALTTFAGSAAAAHLALGIQSRLRRALLEHIQRLGPAFTQNQASAELALLAQTGVDGLEGYFSQYLPQILLAALIPLTILATVLPVDPLSALILLITAPLIPLFMILIGNLSEGLTRRQWTLLSRLSAHFLDTLQGLRTLKELGQSAARANGIRQASDRYAEVTLQVLRVAFISALALELIATLSTAIVAVQIGIRLLNGGLDYPAALTILILAPEFYLPLRTLGLRFHSGVRGLTAAQSLFAVLDLTPAASLPVDPAFPASQVDLAGFRTIRLVGVGYRYPDRDQPALTDFSLTLERGQRLALVGPSGASKSTVAQLLLRFREPQSGQIWVDELPLASLDPQTWRTLVAWVPQRPHLFHGTIADNLRLARPGASLEQLRTAAQLAYLDEWVSSLPAGYASQVGPGGVQVSLGQAQRLALARAFLKDAPLVVLDEPTAHLDLEASEQVEAALRALMQDRTVLAIAHRLSTAAAADWVAVMDAGRLVQLGRPDDLARRPGLYRDLLARQALGPMPGGPDE